MIVVARLGTTPFRDLSIPEVSDVCHVLRHPARVSGGSQCLNVVHELVLVKRI